MSLILTNVGDQDFPNLTFTEQYDLTKNLERAQVTQVAIHALDRGCRLDFLNQEKKTILSCALTSLRFNPQWGANHWRVESLTKKEPLNIVMKDSFGTETLSSIYNSYRKTEKLGAVFYVAAAVMCITACIIGVISTIQFRNSPHIRVSQFEKKLEMFLISGMASMASAYVGLYFSYQSISKRFDVMNRVFTILAVAIAQKDDTETVNFLPNTPLILQAQQIDKK